MTQLESHDGYYLWNYLPSVPAAAIFLSFFALGTGYHAYLNVIHRRFTKYCMVFTLGGLFEVWGYSARIGAHSKTGEILPYALQNLFILLAPALFAASIYMVLKRMVIFLKAEDQSPIKVKILTKLFVGGDILSFVVQGGAAGMMSTGKHMDLANKIIIVGLLAQCISFGLFIVVAAKFHVKMNKERPDTSLQQPEWKKLLKALYYMSALVMVRSIFRVVEFASGQHGYLLEHEWTLYVFDSTLMLGVVGIFAWRYPVQIDPAAGASRLAADVESGASHSPSMGKDDVEMSDERL